MRRRPTRPGRAEAYRRTARTNSPGRALSGLGNPRHGSVRRGTGAAPRTPSAQPARVRQRAGHPPVPGRASGGTTAAWPAAATRGTRSPRRRRTRRSARWSGRWPRATRRAPARCWLTCRPGHPSRRAGAQPAVVPPPRRPCRGSCGGTAEERRRDRSGAHGACPQYRQQAQLLVVRRPRGGRVHQERLVLFRVQQYLALQGEHAQFRVAQALGVDAGNVDLVSAPERGELLAAVQEEVTQFLGAPARPDGGSGPAPVPPRAGPRGTWPVGRPARAPLCRVPGRTRPVAGVPGSGAERPAGSALPSCVTLGHHAHFMPAAGASGRTAVGGPLGAGACRGR